MRMMKYADVRAEALRFVKKIDEAMADAKINDGNIGPKFSGAARRASLDLTRALAAWRKP